MKRTSLLSAALIAFALPLSAQDTAQDTAAAPVWIPGENFIASWDYDGDGTVTLDEVRERRGDLFASFDENEDGKLTPEEFAVHDQMREAMQAGRVMPWGDGQPPMMQGRGGGRGQQQGWGQQQGRGRMQGQGQGWGQQGGQQGWGGPQMQQPGFGYGYGGPGRMGPMQQGGQGWGYGPQGMQQGYGPQGMQQGFGQGYGFGPQGGQPGFGQGFGPQGMQPGFGQGYGPQGGQPGFGPGTGPQGGDGAGGAQQALAMLDADRDGAVSEQEFVSSGDSWFARFDRTGDGVVTQDDFALMMPR